MHFIVLVYFTLLATNTGKCEQSFLKRFYDFIFYFVLLEVKNVFVCLFLHLPAITPPEAAFRAGPEVAVTAVTLLLILLRAVWKILQ